MCFYALDAIALYENIMYNINNFLFKRLKEFAYVLWSRRFAGAVNWSVILGYQFEALILNNLPLLMRHAHVDRTLLESCAPFRHKGTEPGAGFQVDLLMKSRHALYVVEIKRRDRIGETIVNEVREKIRKMRVGRGMSVFPILVYAGDLSQRVPSDGFFSSIISAEDMLK